VSADDRDQTLDKRPGRGIRDQMMRQQADRPVRRLGAKPAGLELVDQPAESGGLADKAVVAMPGHRVDMHIERAKALTRAYDLH